MTDKTFGGRMLAFLSSLRLSVVTMLTLGAVCAYATFYEMEHGTPAARDIYLTPWFAAILGLLGLNVFSVMVSRYPPFDFFVDDEYFRRILELNAGVERSEARFSIDNTLFKISLEAFRKEKEGAGLRTTQLPRSFTQVPLAIQRKLAREGHYVSLFVSHPHPKIALETLRHIATPAAAEAVLLTRTANGRVVAELAKKEGLMGTYRARLALLSHRKAPLEAAQRYAPLMRIEDLRRLAAGHDASPEVGAYLRNRVGPRPS